MEEEFTVDYFKRYCAYIAEKLGDELEYVVTINEANMGLQLTAIAKRYMKELLIPKKKKSTDGNDGKPKESLTYLGSFAG